MADESAGILPTLARWMHEWGVQQALPSLGQFVGPHPGLARVRALVARARLARGTLATLPPLRPGPVARPERPPLEDPVLTLVHRITMGFERGEYERARALGYQAYLEEQLAPDSIADPVMEAKRASYLTLELSPAELQNAYGQASLLPFDEVKSVVVQRAVHSRRQLLERLCEFWNDHFSVDHLKAGAQWLFMAERDRQVIHPHAFGPFLALLSAVAHDAAMLHYLDNWLNTVTAPQENYARELLELHTLGVRGGYTEVDVKEVAKCFTGWSLRPDSTSPDWMRAYFVPPWHVPGDKLVLGHTIDNFPPRFDAQKVLDILGAHPATAEFLARKLLRWFLTPHPPDELVRRVSDTYLATGGDVKAMLRVILAREHIVYATPKFRRPFHHVVSLLRGLGADVGDARDTVLFLTLMGQAPHSHPQPDGFPDTTAAWGAALLPRWDYANVLLTPSAADTPYPGVTLAVQAVAERLDFQGSGDRVGLASRIDARLLGFRLAPQELMALQGFIDDRPGTFGPIALFEAIALAASLPGAQWY